MPPEPIAIIGIGCRFPGAEHPEAFWELLRRGGDAITEMPRSRWNLEEEPNPSKADKPHTRWGGFLSQVDQFEPEFFGIAPLEAHTIDPQQRLMLEVSWEALEDAGQLPEVLAGSQTGVFIGISTHDYSVLLGQRPIDEPYAPMATGNGIAANRISDVLDLKGPSIAVDTACSSSLVAVHLACQSLWQGESTLAIAGGVNVLLLPRAIGRDSKGSLMAADGRRKTFDASADGYVRSEGAGAVILKPLSRAIADQDPIYALIRGSAVNQDGRSQGRAGSNPQSQTAVLRQAYRRAQVNPAQVQYVEVHGLGTRLGDAMELQALGAVLGEGRAPGQICSVGSVKTNIGHLETAAGIAGLIKVALSLKHGQLPPSLHDRQPNPKIDFEKLQLRVQTELQPWGRGTVPVRAGISSLGLGGTNAHVVLEEAGIQKERSERRPGSSDSEAVPPAHLFTLTAKHEGSLRSLAAAYGDWWQRHPQASLAAVCETMNRRRSPHPYRLAIVTHSADQLQQQLQQFLEDSSPASFTQRSTPAFSSPASAVRWGMVPVRRSPTVAFLFTGQGSQYAHMGRQLYETQPVFRAAWEECLAQLDISTARFFRHLRTQYTQPALFTLEYALTRLWMSWGMSPAAVLGHSLGEYVAACIAGVFSLKDALKLVTTRARLMNSLPKTGMMVAVIADATTVQRTIDAWLQDTPPLAQNSLAIAAVNGPDNTVVSGDRTVLEALIKYLLAQQIKTIPLKLAHAFHSPLMQPMLAEFAQVAAQVRYHPPQLPLISNVTGAAITQDITHPDYWCQHTLQPVRFAEGLTCLYQQGYRLFLEVGPQPILSRLGQACLPPGETHWFPSLHPAQPNDQTLLHSLGGLYLQGVPVQWQGVYPHAQPPLTELPPYPFQRQRYWWKGADLPQPLCQPPQPAAHGATEAPACDRGYELFWQLKPLAQSATAPPRHWLILAEPQGLAVQLARALEQQGDRVVSVFPARAYAALDPQTYTLNPTQPQDFQRLLNALGATDIPWGILHLWGLLPLPLEQAQKLGCGSVLYLVRALAEWATEQPKAHLPVGLWLVTRATQAVSGMPGAIAPEQAPLWGLARSLRLEQPNLRCVTLDLESHPAAPERGLSPPVEAEIAALQRELHAGDGEDQVALRAGQRYVARLRQCPLGQRTEGQGGPLALPPRLPYQLQISRYGSLEHLRLVPLQRCAPALDQVEIQVCAAGLSFRDVLNALGRLQPHLPAMGLSEGTALPFGGECAGIVVAVGEAVRGIQVGDAVVAMQAIASLASHVRVNAKFVLPKPPQLSFGEAATLPVAYLTASYGLRHLAALRAGMRVLIHAAAGGVGQAAIQIAQQTGAQIFATAHPSQWEFLRSLGITHLFNSRSLDFADEILRLTDGQGVDVVLNSLTGEAIARSLEVLAPDGHFLEIGKLGIWERDRVHAHRPDITYHSFDLLELCRQQPERITALSQELLDALSTHQLRPLPHSVFAITDAIAAFHNLAQSRHRGKVVLTLSPPYQICPDASYLISGGLGALGLQVAQWLVQQGARHLVLVGRSHPSSPHRTPTVTALNLSLQALEAAGATVYVEQADIASLETIQQIVQKSDFPRIRGVIHAAGVLLADGWIAEQSWQSFDQAFRPKILGAWNLHQATAHLPLDFFVCFSSVDSLLGSPQQSNYAAANAFLDAIAHHRHHLGLPALTINWGTWAGSGMAARLSQSEQQRLEDWGMTAIAPMAALQALESLLQQRATQVGIFQVDWQKLSSQLPQQIVSPLLDALQPAPAPARYPDDHRTGLLQAVCAQIAAVLGLQAGDRIDPQRSLVDLGLTSLMAMEVINTVQTILGRSLPLTLAFSNAPVAAWVDDLLAQETKVQTIAAAVLLSPGDDSDQLVTPDQSNITVDAVVAAPVNLESNQNFNEISDRDEDCPGIVAPGWPAAEAAAQAAVEVPPRQEIPVPFYEFARSPEYLRLRQVLDAMPDNPFFTLCDGIAGATLHWNGRELIHYASYNYLGLAGDPVVCQTARAAIERYGTSVSASRLVAGERPLHRDLEGAIAQFLGTEDCIVDIGGYTTPVTTIGHLFRNTDLILYDACSRNSLRQGCQLSGATALPFAHNDWEMCDRLLSERRHHYQKVLIVIEGVYSTEGDIAPLPEMLAIKQKHKTFLMVDEAHSIGVLGKTGRGIAEHFGIAAREVDLWMGTLSKSLASCGSYVAARRPLVEYLRYTAPSFVFSVGMSPPNAASALAALRQVIAAPERVEQLQQRSRRFLQLAQQHGLNTGLSHDSPIIPIRVGNSSRALQLSRDLLQRGIYVQPMVYPAVPHHAARLRFFISCLHSAAQIEWTIDALVQEMQP